MALAPLPGLLVTGRLGLVGVRHQALARNSFSEAPRSLGMRNFAIATSFDHSIATPHSSLPEGGLVRAIEAIQASSKTVVPILNLFVFGQVDSKYIESIVLICRFLGVFDLVAT